MKMFSLIPALLLLAPAYPAANAQRGGRHAAPAEIRSATRVGVFRQVAWQQQQGRGVARGRRARPLPPQVLERLSKLPPAERERVLENNRRFQQLPPEQQAVLRKRLQQLQEMSPEQRDLIEQRFAIFNNLTPAQQRKAREIYQKQWSKLTAQRRRALLEEFRRLRAMEREEREHRLSSEDFQAQFNAEERELLRQLITL
jgi:hypothetical protein